MRHPEIQLPLFGSVEGLATRHPEKLGVRLGGVEGLATRRAIARRIRSRNSFRACEQLVL